jgi:hypothetical protein
MVERHDYESTAFRLTKLFSVFYALSPARYTSRGSSSSVERSLSMREALGSTPRYSTEKQEISVLSLLFAFLPYVFVLLLLFAHEKLCAFFMSLRRFFAGQYSYQHHGRPLPSHSAPLSSLFFATD